MEAFGLYALNLKEEARIVADTIGFDPGHLFAAHLKATFIEEKGC